MTRRPARIFVTAPPRRRRPIRFPIVIRDLPIDGLGLAIARALRESA